MALSKPAIVEAGLGILDAYGLGDLSMRRVADVLGVQAGALYYHVPNKQSLLAALSDEILGAASVPDETQVEPWLRAWATGLRAALLARRDGAELVASSLAVGLGKTNPTGQGSRVLLVHGVAQPEATMATLLHFVLGHVLEEQTQSQLHVLGVIDAFDADEALSRFDWGIDLIVAGVREASNDASIRE